MVKVQFVTLEGKFAFAEKREFADMKSAEKAIVAYAAAGGYTKVKPVEDEDSIRYTATTPQGRAGRNVAFLEADYEDTGF
jgi:hypothetical protein